MRFYKILLFTLLTSLFANQMQMDNPIVSIHAEDAPLSMILSMLAEESGYNIVTGPNVNSQDKLSIHMNDVSVDQAINLVVRASGLSYEIIGNSILVAKHARIVEDVGMTPHIIQLKYANPDDIVTLLADVTTKITVEKSSNTLLIIASPKKIAEITKIIKSVDRPATQIILEARLIEVSLGDEENIGLDWAKLAGITFNVAEVGSPIKLGQGNSGQTDGLMPGKEYIYDEEGGVTEAFSPIARAFLPDKMYYEMIYDRNAKKSEDQTNWTALMPFGNGMARQLTAFEITLDFLLRNNQATILANSKVVTLNGHSANISMVDVVPYVLESGGQQGGMKVQKEEVGIKLHILPTINEDGYITTSVTPEVSSIYDLIGPDRNIPHIKKRVSNTTVRVKDGETIVISGLLSASKRKQVSRLPILGPLFGWIPYLGGLFEHRYEKIVKTDLIVEITPRILHDGSSGIEKKIMHRISSKELLDFGNNLEEFKELLMNETVPSDSTIENNQLEKLAE